MDYYVVTLPYVKPEWTESGGQVGADQVKYFFFLSRRMFVDLHIFFLHLHVTLSP